jgi:hypothetical protein
MFEKCRDGDVVCVTTNGMVNKNGKLVMGAGNAKYFRDTFKGIDIILGKYVKIFGNRVFKFQKVKIKDSENMTIFSFPTKHNWKDKSDLDLIETSCIQLKESVEKFNILGNIYIPAPGCSLGGLNWETEVKPIIERILKEDKYIICFLPGAYSYEFIEIIYPKTKHNKSSEFQIDSDYEFTQGRTKYAFETAGGYYASRLPIIEYLKGKRKQGRVIVFRCITDDYTTPLGVWVVREGVRKSLETKLSFNNLNS